MKNKENHARTHEKQRTTMQKPMKHHEKTKEKPCKNQWKPRRNNENKCIHHTYPTFMYHLYSMSKWDIWYYFSYSENTFMMCIDTLYMLPVRRRTRGTEEIEEMRKQEDEETKRRRNEPLQLKLSGEKINAEWRLFLLRRPSTWISSNIFFLIPHGAEVFSSFPRFATILYVQYFFFDALNIFFLIPSQYFFLILWVFFLMRHPSTRRYDQIRKSRKDEIGWDRVSRFDIDFWNG